MARPDALLDAAPRPAEVLLCLSPGPLNQPSQPGQPGFQHACVVDGDTGAALGVTFPGEPAGTPLRAAVCPDQAALPHNADGQLIATGDTKVAEEWVLKGGRVVFLQPPAAAQDPSTAPEWRTALPGCDLAAVVLSSPAQREHARWVLAQRAIRELDTDDRRGL
jgi:hypothetical protein